MNNSLIESVTDELLLLRKEKGFTPSRALDMPTLLQVMGGANQDFQIVKRRFISAIDVISDKGLAECLLASYGLLRGYENIPTLKERREKYEKVARRKQDTLNKRERMAIADLAPILLNAYYAGAPLSADFAIPHMGLLMEYLHVITIIVDGDFKKHTQERRIISLVDTPQGKKDGFAYHSRSKTNVKPLFGISEVRTEHVENGSLHTLVFSEPLQRNRAYKFAFEEIIAKDSISKIENNFAGQSFETPTLEYKQQIIFKGKIPKKVWYYKNLSDIERPGKPTSKNRLDIDKNGAIEIDLKQLYGGLRSGIAWEW
ncbi:hypothetical protein I6N96_05085 [Enterococcus sp. BWM-S5]|uniref:Uncharacterized protein n=1 Tax=Enterococcus larvae TaxID=2794352 RepID=A0ABS4CGS0_9ENTE|nr:hypothetical protein [Enterococcus larvae]MBP1045643.1 hypothetical protein [Enterococcus larvae]